MVAPQSEMVVAQSKPASEKKNTRCAHGQLPASCPPPVGATTTTMHGMRSKTYARHGYMCPIHVNMLSSNPYYFPMEFFFFSFFLNSQFSSNSSKLESQPSP